jgi:uncharacterized protein
VETGRKVPLTIPQSVALNSRNVVGDSRYERKGSKNGECYFVLKASNGQIIGKSDMYSRSVGMENRIASVKKNGSDAQVADST